MHVTVTGGSGFLGRWLINGLTAKQHTVTNIDLNSPPFGPSIGEQFFRIDIMDKSVKSHIQGSDYIFHLAAQTSSIISEEGPLNDLQTNVLGTQNIIDAAQEFNVPLHFLSSMAVYGDGPTQLSSSPQPLSIYGISKFTAEQLIHRASRLGLRTHITRLYNVYGPGQDIDNYKQGMASIFAVMAIKDKKILVKGNLERSRDFVYVQDVRDFLIEQMESNLAKNGKNYRLDEFRSGRVHTVKELLDLISDICFEQFNFKPKTVIDEGFKNDVGRVSRDENKIRRDLIPLEEGMLNMMLWIEEKLREKS